MLPGALASAAGSTQLLWGSGVPAVEVEFPHICVVAAGAVVLNGLLLVDSNQVRSLGVGEIEDHSPAALEAILALAILAPVGVVGHAVAHGLEAARSLAVGHVVLPVSVCVLADQDHFPDVESVGEPGLVGSGGDVPVKVPVDDVVGALPEVLVAASLLNYIVPKGVNPGLVGDLSGDLAGVHGADLDPPRSVPFAVVALVGDVRAVEQVGAGCLVLAAFARDGLGCSVDGAAEEVELVVDAVVRGIAIGQGLSFVDTDEVGYTVCVGVVHTGDLGAF